MTETPDPEIDRLFAAWLAGPLAEDQSRRLAEVLGDAASRRRWRELADLEGALAERGAAVAAEPAHASPISTRRLVVPPPRRRRWWPMALAAALLLMLGGGLWRASLVADRSLPSSGGHRLARGEAVDGASSLRWDDGSEATLAADTAARVPASGASGMGLELLHGGIALRIAHQSGGARFIVTTPHATAEVLGTRFTLRTDASATSLVVEEGRVRFREGSVTRDIGAGGVAVAGTPRSPSLALVAAWPMGEGSGSIVGDASGHGHDGVIAGPRWSPEGLEFSGGDERVDIAPSGDLSSVQNGNYSICARFRPDAFPLPGIADPSVGPEALSVIAGRTGWTLGLYVTSDGRFFMQHFLADHRSRMAISSQRAELGRWYQLVGVVDRDAGETRLAVDGVVVGRTSWPAGSATCGYFPGNPWRIGISSPGPGDCRWPTHGVIRDVRIYGKALDIHEIARLGAAK